MNCDFYHLEIAFFPFNCNGICSWTFFYSKLKLGFLIWELNSFTFCIVNVFKYTHVILAYVFYSGVFLFLFLFVFFSVPSCCLLFGQVFFIPFSSGVGKVMNSVSVI